MGSGENTSSLVTICVTMNKSSHHSEPLLGTFGLVQNWSLIPARMDS